MKYKLFRYSSQAKIISEVQKHALTVIENVYSNNKILKTSVSTIQ